MLKPLKAAPYGFLHYMEVLFMGGGFRTCTCARVADVSGKTGGNTIITNHATSNFMPAFTSQRKMDGFIVETGSEINHRKMVRTRSIMVNRQ